MYDVESQRVLHQNRGLTDHSSYWSVLTRWYSSNGPAARLLRRSLFVLILVTYGPLVTCYVYSCPNICIIPYLSRFPEVTIPSNSLNLESYFYQEYTFSWKSYFSEVAFPRSHISQEVLFPWEETFCHT